MKITIEVDDALLAEVKEFTGCKTNEDTIHYALEDITKYPHMKEYYGSPNRLYPEDLADALYPDYDPKDYKSRKPDPWTAPLEELYLHETADSAGQ